MPPPCSMLCSWEAGPLRQSLIDAYGAHLPPTWVDAVVAQTSSGAEGSSPPQSCGRTVQVSRFHGPKLVLIGDAGHAMTNASRQVRRADGVLFSRSLASSHSPPARLCKAASYSLSRA